MRFNCSLSLFAALLLVSVVMPTPANAALVTYTYTGPQFSSVAAAIPAGITRISFSFTVDDRLAALSKFWLSEAHTYEFSDGRTSVLQDTAGWAALTGWVKTNAAGNISEWAFYSSKQAPWTIEELRYFSSEGSSDVYPAYEDLIVYSGLVSCDGFCSQGASARTTAPTGVWVLTTLPSSVPEPATMTLLALGLLAIILLDRRIKTALRP
jgi:hypothetical protein